MLEQGAEVESAEVLSILDGECKTVVTDGGDFVGRAVIVAAGTRHRLLGLAGEESFIGNGISFCAVCDGAFYQGQTVGVVGGGNSALQEALLLSETSRRVYVIQDLDHLTGEGQLQRQLMERSNVELLLGTTVSAYLGAGELTGVRLYRRSDGHAYDLPLDGLFLAVGLLPQNEPFGSVLPLDARGYAAAGEDCLTATPGIFVAGDCRAKAVRQLTTAAADGAVAALAANSYLGL